MIVVSITKYNCQLWHCLSETRRKSTQNGCHRSVRLWWQKNGNRYKTINAQMRCQIPSITKKLSEYVTIKDTNINPHENGQPKMRWCNNNTNV